MLQIKANEYKKIPIKIARFILFFFRNGYKNIIPNMQAERNHIAPGGSNKIL